MLDTYERLKNYQPVIEFSNDRSFREATSEIINLLKSNSCTKVLEVCCGTGKLLQEIERNGMEATGIDVSPTMLDRAKKKKRARNLRLMDAEAMDFNEEFDAAIIQISLHEMSPATRNNVVNNMKRAIKQGGIVIISDFAITANKSINARITGYFIRKGEDFFLGFYPEHHVNYTEFMENGGIDGFVRDEHVVSLNKFMHGHLGVACVKK